MTKIISEQHFHRTKQLVESFAKDVVDLSAYLKNTKSTSDDKISSLMIKLGNTFGATKMLLKDALSAKKVNLLIDPKIRIAKKKQELANKEKELSDFEKKTSVNGSDHSFTSDLLRFEVETIKQELKELRYELKIESNILEAWINFTKVSYAYTQLMCDVEKIKKQAEKAFTMYDSFKIINGKVQIPLFKIYKLKQDDCFDFFAKVKAKLLDIFQNLKIQFQSIISGKTKSKPFKPFAISVVLTHSHS